MVTIPDYAKLRQSFSDAIAKLPDYKRRDVWEYVKALETRIEKLEKDIEDIQI